MEAWSGGRIGSGVRLGGSTAVLPAEGGTPGEALIYPARGKEADRPTSRPPSAETAAESSASFRSTVAERRRELRIGMVGCGYWGSKHVRVLNGLRGVRELALVEPNERAVKAVSSSFPAARSFPTLDLALPHVDAVVVATPPQAHAEVALQALRAGKHVLVEKPLATSVAAARMLEFEARRSGLVLMVGHTFQFNPAVRELRRRCMAGQLGEIYYVHSARLNLGLYRPDVNVVWDLAPHDISIMNYLLGSMPSTVSAWGATLAWPDAEDLAYVRLEYEEPRVVGYIHLSWLDPRKTRTVTVVGSERMAVYDDLAEERLRIFDRGVNGGNGSTRPHERPCSYRYGDIVSPHIAGDEPLALQDQHFVDCVLNDVEPETNGAHATAIVATLEAIDRALQTRGPVQVEYPVDFRTRAPGCRGGLSVGAHG